MHRGLSTLNTAAGYLTVGLALLVLSFALPSGFVQGVACGAGIVTTLIAATRMGRGAEHEQQPEQTDP
ncbi:hypothetical protein [Streptomyces syringium]|uniref:Uncharacterized protein n=1 Tax=Streptomyces syringium TaxID=76729 RepID=A0ABS4Y7C0_9ACTN|nr:hypothetical protein [Streptomyces syringium]MBP2404696.1 hypothetical protein [Streptomyces syringium]